MALTQRIVIPFCFLRHPLGLPPSPVGSCCNSHRTTLKRERHENRTVKRPTRWPTPDRTAQLGPSAVLGMAFVQPVVVRSPVDLTFGPAAFHLEHTTYQTRGFNGTVPGPTIRTAPGEPLRVTLHNVLAKEAVPSVPSNVFRMPNTTSFHTHGLHVSPRYPADDALRLVPPSRFAVHEYQLPVYHMGGTHWYHPHSHGGSAMQVGGGALGMLIVDDAPGLLPPEVAGLEERHIVISDLNPEALANIGKRTESECRGAGGLEAACQEAFWTPSAVAKTPFPHPKLLLVNGRQEPRMHLLAGQWYRFRLLFGSAGGGAGTGGGMMMHGRRLRTSDFDGTDVHPTLAGCEIGLLAKDGVYLHRAPRPITRGLMSAGNRADWLVQCPAGTHTLADDLSGATLAHVIVAASALSPAPPIAPFAVSRPCYVADLADAPVAVSHEFALDHMRFQLSTDGRRSVPFPGEAEPAAELPVGKVVEMRIDGTSSMSHVFHMHVNPFQLQDAPSADVHALTGGYFEKGDWHDTIRANGAMGGHMMHAAPLRTRFQTDAFTGIVPLHCHYLVHEDQGMLALMRVAGAEGSTFDGAERLDPSCYRSSTPGAWRRVSNSEMQAASAVVSHARPLNGTHVGGMALLVIAVSMNVLVSVLGRRRCTKDLPALI